MKPRLPLPVEPIYGSQEANTNPSQVGVVKKHIAIIAYLPLRSKIRFDGECVRIGSVGVSTKPVFELNILEAEAPEWGCVNQ